MKFLIYLAVFVISNVLGLNFASANEAQLGIILGSSSGLSGKYDLGGDRALDAALAYSTDSKYGNYFHMDYLFNRARQFPVGSISPAVLYYGLGVRIINIKTGVDNGKSKIGIRAPIGLHTQMSNPDLEFFGEIAPALDIAPSTDLFIDVGIGVRIRF